MARKYFIFPFIVVYFLTIVSKSAFCSNPDQCELSKKSEIIAVKDTLNSIFQDDFERGICVGWKQSDDWEVSTVEKISGEYSLKHSPKATSGSSSIFHTINADWSNFDMEWSFNLKNGKWDPSSSNRFWFYLSADTIRTDIINGFAVGVNASGSSDLLGIWRIINGKADSLVVESDLDWNASTLAAIHAKRTTQGVWTLDCQKSGEAKSKTFTGTDLTLFDVKNIGLCFNFTSTRAGQLWLDDVFVNQLSPELFILKLLVINAHKVALTFNKPINPASIRTLNFILTNENNQNIPITQALPTNGSDRSVDISFGKTDGVDFMLNVSGVSDLSGNVMKPDIQPFSLVFSPEVGSVLINEVLFNPFPGGTDFVELVNVSENAIPVNRLKLATRNDTMGLKQIYPISAEKRYLRPGQFLTCTKDPAIIVAQYISNDPVSFCAMKSFPSYSDDSGTVVLLNDSLRVLDEFSYSANMHSPFLVDEEGVSLERISLKNPTADRSNWASAAASAGYATPGLPNSQTESETVIQDEITPEPKAFSPNGDGYNDQLSVKFKLSKPGYIANVRIFDSIGRQVKFLVKNQSLAQDGSWFWNGDSDSGQRLNLGVYIILVELFDQVGHIKTFKKACTLTDRLD